MSEQNNIMKIKVKGLVEITVPIVLTLIIIYFSFNATELLEIGFIGEFALGFLSTATVFIPGIAIIPIAQILEITDHAFISIIAISLGSAIGELSSYFIGIGSKNLINKGFNKSQEELLKKYGPFAIFLLSFIPNPFFDAVGIFAGFLKMPIPIYLIATFFGKVLRYALIFAGLSLI